MCLYFLKLAIVYHTWILNNKKKEIEDAYQLYLKEKQEEEKEQREAEEARGEGKGMSMTMNDED